MGKKHHYEIVLNDGEVLQDPLIYKFGSTPDIELHITFGKARIVFEQGAEHAPGEFLTSKDHLRTDAVKKVLLLHLLKYGSPLDILCVNVIVDGEEHKIFERTQKDEPLIYSMVEGKLDHPLPKSWLDGDVLQTILSMPKSRYDGRMNAVIALLIGKSKQYYCEKSMYLWMSMNGFYNYLTEQVKTYEPETRKNLRGERQQHQFFCAVMHLPRIANVGKDADEIVLKKALSLLCHLEMRPDELYENLKAGRKTEYAEKLAELLKEYDVEADPMTFLVMWLPYKIRCNYFHANQAVPLFLYADEALLRSLEYTNYFVERFVEDNLPKWMQTKDLPEGKKAELRTAYRALSK